MCFVVVLLEEPASAIAPIGVVVPFLVSLLESFPVLVVISGVVSIEPVKVSFIEMVVVPAMPAHVILALAHTLTVARVVPGPVSRLLGISPIVRPPSSLGQSYGGHC